MLSVRRTRARGTVNKKRLVIYGHLQPNKTSLFAETIRTLVFYISFYLLLCCALCEVRGCRFGSVVLPEKWICHDGWHQWHCTGLSLLLNHSFKLILWAQQSRCALCPSLGPGSSNSPAEACMPITPPLQPPPLAKKSRQSKKIKKYLLTC